MRKFKVEKIINSAQFTLDHAVPLERQAEYDNLPFITNTIVINGPFIDSKYSIELVKDQIVQICRSINAHVLIIKGPFRSIHEKNDKSYKDEFEEFKKLT